MKRRSGFTLVELLVAMALIIFVMAIISEVFSVALTTFRNLKAVGDMNERLRTANTLLLRDLSADHFEGKKRLSDANFWAEGPPREGFFRIFQDNKFFQTNAVSSTNEGEDVPDNIPSFRTTATMLHFAVKYRGNQRGDFLQASLPAGSPLNSPFTVGEGPDSRYQDTTGTYSYQWAEVAYFLRPSVDANGNQDTANGTPLFTLYRRQLVAVPDNNFISGAPLAGAGAPVPNANYLEVSCNPDPLNAGKLYFNGPIDLTVPLRRFATTGATSYPSATTNVATAPDAVTTALYNNTYPTLSQQNTANAGGDILLTDVVTFDVRVLLSTNNDFVDLYDSSVAAYAKTGGTLNNSNFDFPGQTTPLAFDTWSSVKDDAYDFSGWATPGSTATLGGTAYNTSIPLYTNASGQPISIKAIQITLRIWDSKTQQSRQTTIIQDL